MHAADEVFVPTKPSIASRAAVWFATGLGVGLVTPAPGTVAGLWGVGLAASVALISPLGVQITVILLLALFAIPICGSAARSLGASGDPGAIVLDEIVALPIVFVGAPAVSWPIIIAGYVLFRICDIAKPGLARSAERLPGGVGIVADDCVAAVLACLLLHGTIWLDAQAGLHWIVPSA
jgi:phosphatidylglycerophosphatase A